MSYRRAGFTLIELLVVIAIIAILAAILFPVFSQAKDQAKSAQCSSNLKNLGMAFHLYANDFDDFMPNPGGGTSIITGGSPRNTWLEYTRDPVTLLWKQDRGIFPYVKQRDQANPNANVYSCPNAQPYNGPRPIGQTDRDALGNQNYVMNDFLRQMHPGSYATNILRVSGMPVSFAHGLSTTQMEEAASVILLYEATQFPAGTNNRNGSPYHARSVGASSVPFYTIGAPYNFHANKTRSNFVFCDGHVKSYKSGATWTPEYNPTTDRGGVLGGVEASNVELWNNVCVPNRDNYQCGSGSKDLWNPRVGGVIYP